MAKTKTKRVKKAVKKPVIRYETVPLITVGTGFNTTLINVRGNIDSLIAQYGEDAQLEIEAVQDLEPDYEDNLRPYDAPYIVYAIKRRKG